MSGPRSSEALKGFLNTLRAGEVRTGFIRGPEPGWLRIDHPADAVSAGQRVMGEIIDVGTRRGQVQLSLKALRENPLALLADQTGLVTTGTVTKLIPFGAFVRIADGVEGLVHNSEFRDEPLEDPSRIVSEGDVITVRILDVDLVRHRLTLSARTSRVGDGEHRDERPERLAAFIEGRETGGLSPLLVDPAS